MEGAGDGEREREKGLLLGGLKRQWTCVCVSLSGFFRCPAETHVFCPDKDSRGVSLSVMVGN